MKKIILLASFLFLGACAGNKVNETKPVTAEIYLLHSKMKSYEVIGQEDRRLWDENLTIEDIIKELPKDSKASLIYKTTISSNWGEVTEKEDYNFLDEKWEIKNKDKKHLLIEDIKFSSFGFKMKPIYFSDGRAVAEMRFNMKFLVEIIEYESKDGLTKGYQPVLEIFQDSKSIEFLPNKYYVFSTIPLKDKSSFILIYKLKN